MNLENELSLLKKIGPAGVAKIKKSERLRFQDIDAGRISPAPYWLRPCRVRILMVVDNGVSYNQFYFGLSEVLDTLRNNPEFWVEFEVTRAHRGVDPNPPASGSPAETLYGAHHINFKFTEPGFDINEYQQVWFFGFESGQNVPHAMDDEELKILYRWMNETGGGVFATGDHANLGESLCSKIPRVRNMRHWSFPQVPIASGEDRHDSLVPGRDYLATAQDESSEYTFDDESDDIPMKLRLRRYYDWSWLWPRWKPFHHWRWFRNWSPHPVLCGAKGPIDVFPDHPHEGHVVTPSDLTLTPGFNGYSHKEYPNYGSSPLSPEIIAWARVQDDHEPGDFKGIVNPKEFGAVGAYDGHKVGVGRVVVDSTWHHWFDVNLTGRMSLFTDVPGNIETGDPRKLNGFLDTPAGISALDRIRNYFRNVAIWLSTPEKIKCMSLRAMWGSLFRYPLREELSIDLPLLVIGRTARDAIGRRAGQCTVRSYWPILIEKFTLLEQIDPEILQTPIPELEELGDIIVGGTIREMLKALPGLTEKNIKPDDKTLSALADRGVESALDEIEKSLQQSMKAFEELSKSIKKTGRHYKTV